MKRKWAKPVSLTDVFVVVLLCLALAGGCFLGSALAAGKSRDSSELELLREHNQKLLEAMDANELLMEENNQVVVAVQADAVEMYKSIVEVQNYLDMAESALGELDRAVQARAAKWELEIIVRDIRETLQDANKLLDEALSLEITESIVDEARGREQDPWLITAMLLTESNGRPEARGAAGEYGLMQIMPGTGRWVAGQLGYKDWEPAEMLDVKMNIEFASFYLWAVTKDMSKYARTEEEKVWLGVLAYNAGPGGAKKWIQSGGRVDKHFYVCRVRRTYDRLSQGRG